MASFDSLAIAFVGALLLSDCSGSDSMKAVNPSRASSAQRSSQQSSAIAQSDTQKSDIAKRHADFKTLLSQLSLVRDKEGFLESQLPSGSKVIEPIHSLSMMDRHLKRSRLRPR